MVLRLMWRWPWDRSEGMRFKKHLKGGVGRIWGQIRRKKKGVRFWASGQMAFVWYKGQGQVWGKAEAEFNSG